MRIAFTPGSIGVKATQEEAIQLAHYYGFESVQPLGNELQQLPPARLAELPAELRSLQLSWAAAGLGVDFRKDEAIFQEGLRAWPAEVKALQRAGVNRIGTWIMPAYDSLTYLENFKQHVGRLRAIASIALDHGMRLGLEYVGTKTLWTSRRFPFLHTMAEAKELIAAIDKPNIGFVLDSWHWWTADETADDILTLTNDDVVSCDLNDAPSGIPKERQQDSARELPLATGVIPAKEFLEALVKIDYDGPVRAEPFNKKLNDMPNEQACAETMDAMKKAFALIGG